MENKHRLIKGYRDLSQEEVDFMNEIKKKDEEVGKLVERIRSPDLAHLGIDLRWVSIAETDLQTGFMALIRSIAKPSSFLNDL